MSGKLEPKAQFINENIAGYMYPLGKKPIFKRSWNERSW